MGSLIDTLLLFFLIGCYAVPLLFVFIDIFSRYENKKILVLMIGSAIVFLPIFLIIYYYFRKQDTKDDVKIAKADHEINLIHTNSIECPDCSTISNKYDKFCYKCGKQLQIKCEGCNYIVQSNWDFCASCGFFIGVEENLVHKLESGRVETTNSLKKISYKYLQGEKLYTFE